ncbi:MAG: helix-turn-helix domain-containing protein [Chloroflexi bacterium]|nr:helix-turn-helix domain-containing protein [Chloroflexota bacterium]
MPDSSSQWPVYLTISKACHFLGVSETTLRQWTDEGKVKAFVTPGGHRRYSESDLKELLRGQHHAHGLKDLVSQIESAAPKQREISNQYLRSADWYVRLDERSRELMKQRGKALLALIVQYVARPVGQPDTLASARRWGHDYGAKLAELGLSLTEALEAFVLHRAPVLDAAVELLKDKEPVNRRTLTSIPKINSFVDQTLLALVQGHQSYTGGRERPTINR